MIGISTPSAPVWVGGVGTPGDATGVAASGNYAYVADSTEGLRVIDVSNPSSPAEVGSVGTADIAEDVAYSGGFAYVAASGSGLRVIDVGVPSAPSEVAFVDTPGTSRGVAVAGGHAYVADGNGGLRVVDISNPVAPVEVGHSTEVDNAYDITVANSVAYVSDGGNGLKAVDVSDPTAPVLIGQVSTPGSASHGVASDGQLVYVAEAAAGVEVFWDVSTVVFFDDFESGNTSAWSNTTRARYHNLKTTAQTRLSVRPRRVEGVSDSRNTSPFATTPTHSPQDQPMR